MKSGWSGRLTLIAVAVLFCLYVTTTVLAGSPPRLDANGIERVDFFRSDTAYRALLAGDPQDREIIARLVNLYNQATASLGPEVSLYDEQSMPFFLNRAVFSLSGGGNTTLFLVRDGVLIGTVDRCRSVTDPVVADQLAELILSCFVPTRGVWVSDRVLSMNSEVTVSSDAARGEQAHILLSPSYSPMTIPSAPFPYPVPEAILLAVVPIENDRFCHTFTLTEETGRQLDGSPGRPGPGAWTLVVTCDSGMTSLPVTIVPEKRPEPRAVVYQHGTVFSWTTGEGLHQGTMADLTDQPLVIGQRKRGSPDTDISLGFLRDWLAVPVVEVEAGQYLLGGSELGLTVAVGEDRALANGTMLSLGGPLRERGGVLRLPWSPELRSIFGYRVQWLGPQQVAFLVGMDRIPAQLREAIAAEPVTRGGRAVRVTQNGQDLGLTDSEAYLDAACGRVMVSIRAVVESLGGRVDRHPMPPGYRDHEAGLSLNGGLAPYGEDVAAWVDVVVGENAWRLYLTSAQTGSVMVPLRQLATALGLSLSWDGPGRTANLRLEE